MLDKIKIGISACLLGEKVRYDGGDKFDHRLIEKLAPFFDLISVCPEVECGFGVPREATRLAGDPSHPRMITVASRTDRTAQLESWAKAKMREWQNLDLSGFIFKSKSPSCGLQNIRIWSPKENEVFTGTGIFARIWLQHFPQVPMSEEKQLHQEETLKNFIDRVHAYQP